MIYKYQVAQFEATDTSDLAVIVNEFYEGNTEISVRDVSYLMEQRIPQVPNLGIQQITVVFVCMITYKLDLAD